MEQVERVVVPVEEAVRYLEMGDEAHLRLALLLLDSTAELLMHRECANKLTWLDHESGVVRQFDRINERLTELGQPREPDDALTTEYRQNMISNSKRKKIEQHFDSKAEFLVERGSLDPSFVRVLSKLHKYRNEAYHRDELRPKTLLASVQIYVYLISQMMRALPTHWMSHPAVIPAGLREYLGGHDSLSLITRGVSFDLQGQIGEALLSKGNLTNHDLAPVLAAYLADRLAELVQDLDWAAESNPSHPDWTAEGIWYLVQIPSDVNFLTLRTIADVIAYPSPNRVAFSQIARWCERTADLELIEDRVGAFTAFADIEDELEPVESLVKEHCMEIERQIQLEIDIVRGK
jgi:hypothetical protein